jgi:hypothetical protein
MSQIIATELSEDLPIETKRRILLQNIATIDAKIGEFQVELKKLNRQKREIESAKSDLEKRADKILLNNRNGHQQEVPMG